MKLKYIALIFFTFSVLTACDDDNDSLTGNDPTITQVKEYTGELTGIVFYGDNANGIQDVGEPDATGIDVFLLELQ